MAYALPVSSHHRRQPALAALLVLAVFAVATGVWVITRPNTSVSHAGEVVGYTAAPPPTPSPWIHAPAPPDHISVPAGSKVLFIGDSWTEGYGAVPETLGWSYQVARAFHWDARIDGIGRTGYASSNIVNGKNLGKPYGGRLEQFVNLHPKLVVIAGGINDYRYVGANYGDQVLDTLRLAKKLFKNVIVVGPCQNRALDPGSLNAIDQYLKYRTQAISAHYLSCVQEGWFTAKNIDTYVSGKIFHPTIAGYSALARDIEVDLRKIITN